MGYLKPTLTNDTTIDQTGSSPNKQCNITEDDGRAS